MHRISIRRVALSVTVCLLSIASIGSAAETQTIYSVGVAQIDITPDYPIRLSGFGFRRSESEGVTMPIFAKAIAISAESNDDPVILITVDNLGISAAIGDEVAKRLSLTDGAKRSRLAIAASHTHTGPMLRGVAPTLFGGPIPDDHLVRIDRYTSELIDRLEQVARAALNGRKPSRLTWGIGSVNFAMNRRTKGGPVDHDLPLLAVREIDGTLRAIYVGYACHCVTLSDNKISGDWAGYAQDLIQREFPSAIAMVSIGCGADQNPSQRATGERSDAAMSQGAEIAAEVKRMIGGFLAPVNGELSAIKSPVVLEFADLPTRSEWEEKAKQNDAIGYHARVQLERLNRNEPLQSQLDYPITTWTFGSSLAMVFLPGEVVVDYSRRLKKELDGQRLWITAYSNDSPCYIPSERVLTEGGYEGAGAMVYYDRPGPLKTGLEEKIVRAIHQQLDAKFAARFDANKTQGSLPKSPQQSLAQLQTTSNLRVDLVVAEPLIADPVAIDFGLDGSLWVAEMRDYPTGVRQPADARIKEKSSPEVAAEESTTGRIRLVRDRDGDGQFDSSTIFLDHIPFPTGVTVWKNGVLICSAPDILYAEDTDGDDRADVVTKLFTGFGTSNVQARVNSLVYGLDGWIHGSCGLFGGTITNFKGQKFELGDRDFRIKPETGEIEAVTGRTQQGRVRDDFGRWFGCDNTNLAFHYPLAERYLKRNPHVASPSSRVDVIRDADARQLFPARSDAQRFALSGPPGTVTAACGIGFYRDSRLGKEYVGNLFVCEPVNLLVHRMVLKPNGSSFEAERPSNEVQTEFLRSTDGWFRPVQALTGPDGSLWVVDMYRFIIENPRWIPAHELEPLDVRAGTSLGRIYRVRSAAVQAPPGSQVLANSHGNPVYDELDIQRTAARAEHDGPSGTLRDGPLRNSANDLSDPQLRIRHYRRLEASQQITVDDVNNAIKDPHPGIRAYGLMLAESHLPKDVVPPSVVEAISDSDSHVRLQAACSLGEWELPETGTILAKLAMKDIGDQHIVAAVFSSVSRKNIEAFGESLFADFANQKPPRSLVIPFLATAVGYSDDAAIKLALAAMDFKANEQPDAWQMDAVANLIDSLSRRTKSQETDSHVSAIIRRVQGSAREIAVSDDCVEESRLSAINLLERDSRKVNIEAAALGRLLIPQSSPAIQRAAVEALERGASNVAPFVLAEHFQELSPTVQPRVVDAFLSRRDWMLELFHEMKTGRIPPSAIVAAQRQELIAHPDPFVRKQANALLAISYDANRRDVIEKYRPALELKGDFERGQTLFKKSCSQCHKIGDTGYAVGPNLEMAAHKTPSYLLQEILDPNRNIDSRYVSYAAITRNGLTRTGLLFNESPASVTLLAGEGKEFTLLRKQLEEFRATGKSLMPEGLEKDLSHQAMADLIEFLTATPARPKQFEGNRPEVVRSIERRLALVASNASIFGDQIAFERPFGNIGYWHGQKDYVLWMVDLSEAEEFDVYLDYACDPGSAGNKYLFEAGTIALSGQVETTGGWHRYSTVKIGTMRLPAGVHRITLRPDTAIRGALLDLKGIYLIPRDEVFNLLAFGVQAGSTDVVDIARQILDDTLKEELRMSLIDKHADRAAELIVAMTRDMPDDHREEYRRIPWIWRVAVAVGKRDQAEQLRSLLEVSVPKLEQPLRDWQAVVIGGGIVNGIGLSGGWPRIRIEQIIRADERMTLRWRNLLSLASRMADRNEVPPGTRYDALRIVALDEGKTRRGQLARYLAKGTDDELQMGAISGLSDVESGDVAGLLVEHIDHFNEENRRLAIAALMRTEGRCEALLEAVAGEKIPVGWLSPVQQLELQGSTNPSLRERAIRIFRK